MSRFVLDNTITMAWCFSDEANDVSKAILNRLSNLTDTAFVPSLWPYEVANVIELATRKGRIPSWKAAEFFQILAEFPIEVEEMDFLQVFRQVRALAGKYRLTVYDAAYLELAIRLNLPIATFDKELVTAARSAGIQVLDR